MRKLYVIILLIALCAGAYLTVKSFIKPVEIEDGEKLKVVYRYSADILFNGDKIDLENKKITNYTKFNDALNGDYKNVAAYETKDMTGKYSTNLNDVLKTDTVDREVYIKHTIDQNGIIKKTELCGINSWGTLCRTYEGIYDESIGYWTNPKYAEQRQAMIDYSKWDAETEKSLYSEYVRCDDYSSDDYEGIAGLREGHSWKSVGCSDYSVVIKLDTFGDMVSLDSQSVCKAEYGASYCE